MRSFIYIFLLIIICVNSASSQVPGYRGKKVILKCNASGMPAIGYFFSDENFFDLNLRFSTGLDVVLTKRISMGISLEQVNDIIYFNKYTVSSAFPISSSNDFDRLYKYKSAANFHGWNYGANIKIFSFNGSGSIAPFGRFIILEYLYNKIKVDDDGRFYASGKKDLNDFHSHSFHIGIGSQKVYFNRITLEGNVKLGFNTYGWSASRKNEIRLNYDEVYRMSSSKMLSDYMLTAGIGIGFLAF
jgi:hypothetical protein